MKPFDLQAALAGQPVITRDGCEVAFIARDPCAQEHARLVFRLAGETHYYGAREDGVMTCRPGYRSDKDLFMAPKTHQVWVNVFIGGGASWHATKPEAEAFWRLKGQPARFGASAHRIEVEE